MDDVIKAMRERLAYNPETGSLLYAKRRQAGKTKVGDEVGSMDRHGYRKMIFDGRTYLVHRVVWMMHYGRPPNGILDHINGIRLDNRIANLREATLAENAWNSSYSRTGLNRRGVTRVGGKFHARIRVHGKVLHLGTFTDPDAAHAAYKQASLQHRGEFSPYAAAQKETP